MSLRFHLDEHIHPAIAVGLRAHGLDVTTAIDAGLLGAEDHEHLAFALSQGRVMVTHDEDYLRLDAAGTVHCGIAYCHQDKVTIGQHLQLLQLLESCYTSEEMNGRVEYL